MSTSNQVTILFHGNCIDGWFSAYIAYYALKNSNIISMFPISPSQTHTWPSDKEMAGTHILLVDVSVSQTHRDAWTKAGALSIQCIDHHASSIEHWPSENCPINTESCAAIQTWKHFFPQLEIPFWLHHIDRIDRWDNPTYEDRCIREILNEIAHKPVNKKIDEALIMTEKILFIINTPQGIIDTIARGKEILDKKDASLLMILNNGTIHTFTPDYIVGWNLPESWLNANVFIIDNTNIVFDTTEAAHLVFTHYPAINVFINYRKKTLYGRGPNAVVKTMYVYSARSRNFNLTDGTIFKGHPTAAGASLIKGEAPILPFLLTAA
jgi:hypothetical protein